MCAFMDEDFLLSGPLARELYHEVAEPLPILDYHCHLDARDIAEDTGFENLTQMWLRGDHYKWRLMRMAGLEERLITGDAPDEEKFLAWSGVLSCAVGNPLYHWSHLELKRYFRWDAGLSRENALQVWRHSTRVIQECGMTTRSVITASRVRALCTTDDPADELCWHEKLAADTHFPTAVLPGWRPDAVLSIEKADFPDYVARLSQAAGCPIRSFSEMQEALRRRMAYFAAHGCRLSDHGLPYVPYAPAPESEAARIFQKRMDGGRLTVTEREIYQSACLLFLSGEYARRGWVMQLHFGVARNVSDRLFRLCGADAGADCMAGHIPMEGLTGLLNAMEARGGLPRTILYSLDPGHNALLNQIAGCFQGEGKCRVQQGGAWWFNDCEPGIRAQLASFASLGLLSGFVGMTTDSRSVLSYTRHEYFRRILCAFLGTLAERGECPADRALLGTLVEQLCFDNANAYFGFDAKR